MKRLLFLPGCLVASMMAVALSGCTGATNTVEMPENPEPPPGIPTAEGATPGEVAVP